MTVKAEISKSGEVHLTGSGEDPYEGMALFSAIGKVQSQHPTKRLTEVELTCKFEDLEGGDESKSVADVVRENGDGTSR